MIHITCIFISVLARILLIKWNLNRLCVGPFKVPVHLLIYTHVRVRTKMKKEMWGITVKLVHAVHSRFPSMLWPGVFSISSPGVWECGQRIRSSPCPLSLSLEHSEFCQSKHVFSLLFWAFGLTSLDSWLLNTPATQLISSWLWAQMCMHGIFEMNDEALSDH